MHAPRSRASCVGAYVIEKLGNGNSVTVAKTSLYCKETSMLQRNFNAAKSKDQCC